MCGVDSSFELINTDFSRVITMRKRLVSKRNGPIGASAFECWKKLKIFWVPWDTLLEISKKAI